MRKKPFTRAQLAQFDQLTLQVSSRNQRVRLNARLGMKQFVESHGAEACDAMFATLRKRDEKRGTKR